MKALLTESRDLMQFIWDEGNWQVSSNNYRTNRYHVNGKNENTEYLYSKNRTVSAPTLAFLSDHWLSSELSRLSTYSSSSAPAAAAIIRFPEKMDFEQQKRLLLAQLVQQQQERVNELKQYQTALQQQQIQNNLAMASTNLWLSLLNAQQNAAAVPPHSLQSLGSPISSVAAPARQQIPGFGAVPGVLNVNYLSAALPAAVPLFNTQTVSEVQLAELKSILAASEQQKIADSAEQIWPLKQPKFMMQQNTIHQQVPSVSPLLKRRVSESVKPQEQQQQQEVVIDTELSSCKRAKVIVIEQSNPEPAPCSSTSSVSAVSPIEKVDWNADNIGLVIKNTCGKQEIRNSAGGNSDIISNRNRNEEEEEEEDAQYVDVESLDEKLDSKEQRKALIEYYRKSKSVRMSYSRDGLLMCQMCEQQIQNSDPLILRHLYRHAEMSPFRCKMCGAGEFELERIYAHIKQGHPNKDPSTTYEIRRDMVQLTCLLQTCFPRNVTKTKAAYSNVIDKICEVVKEKSLTKLTCMVCTRKISTRKMSITRHAQAHLHYRCKDCGVVVFGDRTIVEHSTKKHGIMEPQCTMHYDACVNSSDKTEISLRNCFSNILNEKL